MQQLSTKPSGSLSNSLSLSQKDQQLQPHQQRGSIQYQTSGGVQQPAGIRPTAQTSRPGTSMGHGVSQSMVVQPQRASYAEQQAAPRQPTAAAAHH